MKVNINRQLAGLEDLLFGEGTVEQERQGETVTITKINLSNLPFSETLTAADVLTPIYEEVVPHVGEILLANDNATIASTKASEASASAAAALLSEQAAAASAAAALLSEQAATASEGLIASHLVAEDNPHSVTKAQVGLSNVDNTSDTDKPISILQQEALNLKADQDVMVAALNLKADQDHVHPTDTSRAAAATSVQKDSNTGVVYLTSGTTAQRPVLANNTVGIRYNTETSSSEVGVGTAGATTWSPVGGGGGATGGGTDNVFNENEYVITTDYTIPAGKSAVTVGDASGNVTINSGVTVTLDTNSRWVVL